MVIYVGDNIVCNWIFYIYHFPSVAFTQGQKNHNQGKLAIWVGNGAIIVICAIGLMTKNINYFSALLGFVVGDEVGKQAGLQ